jgi:hypothetical protein
VRFVTVRSTSFEVQCSSVKRKKKAQGRHLTKAKDLFSSSFLFRFCCSVNAVRRKEIKRLPLATVAFRLYRQFYACLDAVLLLFWSVLMS